MLEETFYSGGRKLLRIGMPWRRKVIRLVVRYYNCMVGARPSHNVQKAPYSKTRRL